MDKFSRRLNFAGSKFLNFAWINFRDTANVNAFCVDLISQTEKDNFFLESEKGKKRQFKLLQNYSKCYISLTMQSNTTLSLTMKYSSSESDLYRSLCMRIKTFFLGLSKVHLLNDDGIF